jgi:hypothetical protein
MGDTVPSYILYPAYPVRAFFGTCTGNSVEVPAFHSGIRCQVPGVGYRLPGTGYRIPGTGFAPRAGHRAPRTEPENAPIGSASCILYPASCIP